LKKKGNTKIRKKKIDGCQKKTPREQRLWGKPTCKRRRARPRIGKQKKTWLTWKEKTS